MRVALKRICVPVDFSESADHALQYGITLAERFGASLHLLHVVQDIGPFVGDSSQLGAVSTIELVESIQRDAERELAKIPAGAGAELEVVRKVIIGNPAATIHRYAKEQEIDLLILATHGRTGLSHFFIGSVAERVVRTAPCPVLTVRHPEHEFIVPDDD